MTVATAQQNGKPRVVFFNRSYWPDVEATGQLLTELTQDLAGDFDVEVVVGQPNQVNSHDEYVVAGMQSHGGVKIRRLKHSRFNKHSLGGRLLNLLSFTWAAVRTSWSLPRPDIVVTETDPFFLAFVGRWLQLRHRCRYVVYLQDIYPDIAVAVGKLREGIVSLTLRRLLFGVYRQADCVVVLSRDMERTCLKYGVPAEKIRVIPNWADTRVLKPQKEDNGFRKEHALDGKFVVMYSGNLGLAHRLTPILDAADMLKLHPQVRFVFVGDGARRRELETDCRRRNLDNVMFLPYQPRDRLAQSLSAADAHLVTMQPEATGFLMPSKLYGILASSTPVIALARPDSELYQLVQKSDVGFVCDLLQPQTVAERLAFAVNYLADRPEHARMLGGNARRLAETEFDRPRQTARFGRVLGDLMREEVGCVDAEPVLQGGSV
jgi:glycosyltransferase involved in cell wall biosynthesis